MAMSKGMYLTRNLPSDVANVVDQLERHCLAPDGSLISKAVYNDLQLAKEEMCKQREKYLQVMAIYGEAISLVEERHQMILAAGRGSDREQFLHGWNGMKNTHQAYDTLEHRIVLAGAAQKLRLPHLSDVGDHEEEIETSSVKSRGSFDSSNTFIAISSSSNSTSYTGANSNFGLANNVVGASDITETGIGGTANYFLGITPAYLWQMQFRDQSMDTQEYQKYISCMIEERLKAKCDKLADIFSMDDTESSHVNQNSSVRLSERIKLIIDDVEKEEAALQEDLFSSDRKFSEFYNVLEQIVGVLIKLVKDLKLQHQHNYDDMQKTWLCKRCETMNAKLRVLEHALLLETYTPETIPALHKIRKYILETTEEVSTAYNKAATRLREYQGVDPHFDTIARQYHDVVKKLENLQWTIHQVEMDLGSPLKQPVT